MATQAERRAATIAVILEAARDLFARKGFDATTVDDVVAKAKTTKGGLYHHFASKEELFTAVLEGMQKALSERVARASATERDPLAAMLKGTRAFFEECLDPEIRRIVLLDGPRALGWDVWREIDAKYFGAMVSGALSVAMDQGLIAKRAVGPLTTIFLGAMTEAAMACARSEDPKRDMRAFLKEIERMISDLRVAA
jgi:AcrR family transcriptional regulator